MTKNLIKVNKTSFLALMLVLIMLLSILAPTVSAVTIEDPNIEEKVKELSEDAKQYEQRNGITGEIINFSKFGKGDTTKSQGSSNGGGSYEIVKTGSNYKITLNNFVAKKIILPADDADLEELKEGNIKYTGKARKTHITIVLKGNNRVTGYGIEGYPVKGIKFEGDGNLEVNAYAEPRVERVSRPQGGNWVKNAELTYYSRIGISVETGNQKYEEYLKKPEAYADVNSLVFASTGNITINSQNNYGIVNNGDIKFKSGNIKIVSEKSAVSGYGVYIDPEINENEETFNIELVSQERAFYDRPTFQGSNYIVMVSKSRGMSGASDAEIKSKEDVANNYSSYRYINVKFANEKNAPEISGITVREDEILCSLPLITVTDDTGIDSITVNGIKITGGFSVNSSKKKVFRLPSSNSIQREIVARDVLGNESKMSFMAYNDHQLSKPVKTTEVAPTCTKDGYHINEYTCTVCKNVVKTEKIVDKALGHSFSEWNIQNNQKIRSCTKCGEQEIENIVVNISKCSVALSDTNFEYDGNAKKPAITVRSGSTILKQGIDYTVKYTNNINAGIATVTITGLKNYTGSVSRNFTIKKVEKSVPQVGDTIPGIEENIPKVENKEPAKNEAKPNNDTVTKPNETTQKNEVQTKPSETTQKDEVQTKPSQTTQKDEVQTKPSQTTQKNEVQTKPSQTTQKNEVQTKPSGTTQNNNAQAKPSGTTQNNNTQTKPSGTTQNNNAQTKPSGTTSNNNTQTKPETVKKVNNSIIASNFIKNYSTKSQSFMIGASQKGDAKLTYSSDNGYITVNSSGKVTIKAGYVGKANITIKANSTSKYYAATKKITVTVPKINNSITASNFTKNYSAKAQSFMIGAKQKGNAKLIYSSNTKSVIIDNSGKVTIKAGYAGKASITIKANATSQYNATTRKITINVQKVNNSITASNFTKNYSTKAQSFKIGAKQKGNANLTYSSNNKSVTVDSSGKVTIKAKFIGKANITITANANTGYNKATKKIVITVNPPKVSISKVTNVKGLKMKVTWGKNTAVTGYEVQYSTDKNFKKNVKTVKITKNSSTATTIAKLSKNKKYYVRIRSYKTVSGVKYYSGWSSSKNITIKK